MMYRDIPILHGVDAMLHYDSAVLRYVADITF